MSALVSRGFKLRETIDLTPASSRWCEVDNNLVVQDEQGSSWMIPFNEIKATEFMLLVIKHDLAHTSDEVVEA
jgi:hypothetical protein